MLEIPDYFKSILGIFEAANWSLLSPRDLSGGKQLGLQALPGLSNTSALECDIFPLLVPIVAVVLVMMESPESPSGRSAAAGDGAALPVLLHKGT